METRGPWGDPALHNAADADKAARDAEIFMACEHLIALTSINPKNLDPGAFMIAAYELFMHCSKRLAGTVKNAPATGIGLCIDTLALMAAIQVKAGCGEELARSLSARVFVKILELDTIVQAVAGAPGEKAAS